jgi:trigger factor
MKHDLKKEKDFIEIDFEHENMELEKAFTKEYINIAKNLKVNGFRPGKTPVSVVKNMVKKNEIKDKVINGFLREEVELLSIEDETYGDLEINIVDYNDSFLKSKIKMYLYPTAILPEDYQNHLKNIKIEKDEIEISKEEIEKEMNAFLLEHAEKKKTEEIKNDSVVEIDVEAVDMSNEELIIKEKKYELQIGAEEVDKEFEKEIITLKTDESKEFEITYPDNYHFNKLSNKRILYKVKVNNIYEKIMPEINKELIENIFSEEELTDDLSPYDFLFNNIKEDILENKREEIDKKNYEKIMDALVNISSFNISDYIVNTEKEKIFKNFLNKNELEENLTISDFALMIDKKEEDVEKDFIEITKNKINSYLILNEINKKEKLYENEENQNKEMDLQKLIESFSGNGVDENNFMSLIENMSNLIENDKNDFSLSKEKIKKIIDFLTNKISQE